MSNYTCRRHGLRTGVIRACQTRSVVCVIRVERWSRCELNIVVSVIAASWRSITTAPTSTTASALITGPAGVFSLLKLWYRHWLIFLSVVNSCLTCPFFQPKLEVRPGHRKGNLCWRVILVWILFPISNKWCHSMDGMHLPCYMKSLCGACVSVSDYMVAAPEHWNKHLQGSLGSWKILQSPENWRRKISPWKVLNWALVLKKCRYLTTVVLKNQLGQHVTCAAVVSNRTVIFLLSSLIVQ